MAAAGRLAWECHFLTWSPRDFHRLLRCLREFSSAWKGGRARLSVFRDAQERTRARGEPGGLGGPRRPRRAAWVLFPAPAVLPSDGFGETNSKHPVSLARPNSEDLHLNLTTYICNDSVSKQGHILRLWVAQFWGIIFSTDDSSSHQHFYDHGPDTHTWRHHTWFSLLHITFFLNTLQMRRGRRGHSHQRPSSSPSELTCVHFPCIKQILKATSWSSTRFT